MDVSSAFAPVPPLRQGPAALPPPSARPPVRRAYGVVVLLSAVVWAAAIALFGTVYLVALLTFIASLDPGSTGDPAPAPDLTGPLATSIVLAVAWLVGALVSATLDVAATIMSIQRLVHRVGDAVVPWCTLASLAVSWLLPLLCLAAAVAAGVWGSGDVIGVTVWVCALALYIVVPLSRIVEGVVGIIRTATGETPRPVVGGLA